MTQPSAAAQSKLALIADIARFEHDPLGYVLYAFPWGEGELAESTGPRQWQRQFLVKLGERLKNGQLNNYEAIQEAVSSGHGVGKSALVSWLILWGLSTFEDSRIIVTAGTYPQLKTKTWPELAKWHRLALNAKWFMYTSESLYSADPAHEKTWRCDMMSWSEHRTEAFAGLHNKGKRAMIIFDEGSQIPVPIWEVSEGALTDADTELMHFVFGNPTRNTGRFRECFGRLRHRWGNLQLDARTVEGTNRVQFQKWIEDYGEDSDFVRVRVKGMFPRASSLQFIDSDVVAAAMKREAQWVLGDPLIMALDVARGGDDNCVFRFRRGMDAKSIPPVRIPGSEVRDSMRLISKATELIKQHKPDAFFFDGTGVGGPVGDRIRQLGHNVVEVQFGAGAPDPKYANVRSYMWGKMKDWLYAGGAIEESPILETDLTSVEYDHNNRDQLRLEKKEDMKIRGLASPDDGDALAMTFAYYVAPTTRTYSSSPAIRRGDFDPLSDDRTRTSSGDFNPHDRF